MQRNEFFLKETKLSPSFSKVKEKWSNFQHQSESKNITNELISAGRRIIMRKKYYVKKKKCMANRKKISAGEMRFKNGLQEHGRWLKKQKEKKIA